MPQPTDQAPCGRHSPLGKQIRPGSHRSGANPREREEQASARQAGSADPGTIPAGENERERSAAGIGCEVDLCGQSAAGLAEGVVGRFAGWGPFSRAPVVRSQVRNRGLAVGGGSTTR